MFFKYYNEIKEKIWKNTNERNFLIFVLEKVQSLWKRKNIFIIEAPTGYGKTSISLTISYFSVNEEIKSIISFPLRSLLESQYKKFKMFFEDRNYILGKRYLHSYFFPSQYSPYLIKPITLTTVDTLSLLLFGISPEDVGKVIKGWTGTLGGSLGHYLFSWFSFLFSNIVLDEVHLISDTTKSLNFLIALIYIAILNDQKVILMTATLPKPLENVFKKILKDNKEKIVFIKFSKTELENEFEAYHNYDYNFIEERLNKNYNIFIEKIKADNKNAKIIDIIKKNMDTYNRILVIFNTIKDAQRFYEEIISEDKIKSYFGEENIMLIHSRFTERDKEIINEKIDIFNKKIKNKEIQGLKYLIISTQVLEAGVDVSSNLMITEIAPAASLIQRIGRFLRYEGEGEGKIFIWYEIDEKDNLKWTETTVILQPKEYSEKLIKYLKSIKGIWDPKTKVWKIHNKNKEEVNYSIKKYKLSDSVQNIEEEKKYKVYDWDLTKQTLDFIYRNKDKINFHIPEDENDKIGYKRILNEVYSENNFRYDFEKVLEMLNIQTNLETGSLDSINLFIKLEGSFIRESYLVPIIPYVIYSKIDSKKIEEIFKNSIPLDFNTFVDLLNKGKVKGYIYLHKESEQDEHEMRLKEIDKKIIEKLKKVKKLIKYLVKERILFFIIDANYDNKKGLIINYG